MNKVSHSKIKNVFCGVMTLWLSVAFSATVQASVLTTMPEMEIDSADNAPTSDSVIVNSLNMAIPGGLTEEEAARIQEIELSANFGQEAQFSKTSLVSDMKNISLLVCVSGKAGAIGKVRVGVCSSPLGHVYRLVGYGGGLSVGMQASVFGMAIVSPPGTASIAGRYGGATTMTQSGLGFLMRDVLAQSSWRLPMNGMMRFLLAFGGPEFAVAESNGATLIMAGGGVGPMVDFGKETFHLFEIPPSA